MAARFSAGLTQQDLAVRLGTPQSFISKYENGERRLDILEFIRVADAIGTDYHTIIETALREKGGGPSPGAAGE